jgi:hypothetical protein
MTVAKKASATNRRNQRYNSPRIAAPVTAEIIERSKIGDSSHCMITEALRVAHPEFTGQSADLATVRISDPVRQLRYIYLTPRNAQLAIIDFDQGITPEPFTVVLERAAQITRSANWGRVTERLKPTTRPQKPSSYTPPKSPKSGKPAPLGPRRAQSEGGGSIPTIIGGHPPPVGPLVGAPRGRAGNNPALYAPGNLAKRREFGLRMLRRGKAMSEAAAAQNTPRKKT